MRLTLWMAKRKRSQSLDRRRRRWRDVVVVVLLIATVQSCRGLIASDATGIVEPDGLRNPVGATTLFNGALTLFTAAFNGDGANFGAVSTSAVVVSGDATDELGAAAINVDESGVDARSVAETDPALLGTYLYTALSQARVSALSAAQMIQVIAPTNRAKIGELFALSGYTELFTGELLCSGMTLTVVENGTPTTYGEPLSTSLMFQRAVADFDSAITYGSDSAIIANLGRLGRGRALVNLRRFTEAAAAVGSVPTNYGFTTEHSPTVQPNRLATVFSARRFTVSEREGQNGLAYRSLGDPRVKTAFVGKGGDAVTDVWGLVLPSGQSTPTVVASGVEARLLESEAALQANPNDATTTGSGWLGVLNGLRATAISPALPLLADPGSFDARVDLLFRERALWLFGTAHRLGDLRRLVRQYGRPAASVFPSGTYRLGRTYGNDVTLAPSIVSESGNPNYRGCLDRNP